MGVTIGGILVNNDAAYNQEMNLEDKLDEEIVMMAKIGDEKSQEYLINKYYNFVKAKAKSYFDRCR